MSDLAMVSILIPCRNERKYIGTCLDSIVANDYPKGRVEVLVADGMSENGTRDVLRDYVQRYPFISPQMATSLVSIAMVVCNVERFLARATESILNHGPRQRTVLSGTLVATCEPVRDLRFSTLDWLSRRPRGEWYDWSSS